MPNIIHKMELRDIPIIDFKNLNNSSSDDVFHNFKDMLLNTGYCVIINHGISNHVFENLRRQSEMFFELPDSVKEKYKKIVDKANYFAGFYISKNQAFRERYDITYDDRNYIPEIPKFQDDFIEYRHYINNIVESILIFIAKSFELKADYLIKQHSAIFDGSTNTRSHLSSVYYKKPAQSSSSILMNTHTDISTFTLVNMSSPGLPIYNKNEDMVHIDPDLMPNGFVFLVGDLLQRWTGNSCPATIHQVLNMKSSENSRISIVYFVHPNCDTVVEPFYNKSSYPAVVAENYWTHKFAKYILL